MSKWREAKVPPRINCFAYVIIPDVETNTFTGMVPGCPGCISEGDTPIEAMQNLQEVLEDWLSAAKDLGQRRRSCGTIQHLDK